MTIVLLLIALGLVSQRSAAAVLPNPEPLHGSQPYATLLCQFSDPAPASNGTLPPVSYYDRLMVGAPNSVDAYYRQVSYGAINLTGSKAFGWFQMGKPASAYRKTSSGMADLDSLARDCAATAQTQSGKTLALSNYVGLNLVFSTCVERPRGGAVGLWVAGRMRYFRTTWLCPGYASSQQIFAHEIGHSFGLAHSEDDLGAEYGNRWDLMSNAAYCAASTDLGTLGQDPIAYDKDLLGWIAPGDKYTARGQDVATVQLDYLAAGRISPAGFLLAEVPLSGGRFYTVEARGRMGYDIALPAPGVVIHEVDPQRANRARLVEGPILVGKDAALSAAGGWPVGSVFIDAKNNVGISVDQQVDAGFVVTVYTGELPWPDAGAAQQAGANGTTMLQWQPTGKDAKYEIQVTHVRPSVPAALTSDAAQGAGAAWPAGEGGEDWGATFTSDRPMLAAALPSGEYRWQVRELPHGAWSPPRQVTAGRAPAWLPAEQIAQLASPLRVPPMVGTRSNGDVEVAWATEAKSRSVSVTRLARQGAAWGVADLFNLSSGARRGLALSFTPAGELRVAWPAPTITGARALSSSAVALDAGGRAHAVWAGVSRGTSGIFASVVDAHAPSAGPAAGRSAMADPVAVTSDQQGGAKYSPAIAVDNDGSAQAVWIDTADGASAVYSAEQLPGGAWGSTVRLSDLNKAVTGRPAIAIDGAGNAYAVWQSSAECGGPAPLPEVTFAERPAGGEWQAPVTLAAPGPDARVVDPVVAANDGGQVYVAWGEQVDGAYRLYSAYRDASGDWESPRLAARGATDEATITLSLAVNAGGDAYLTWGESRAGQTVVRFAATR